MTGFQHRPKKESVEESLETILDATEAEVEALPDGVVKETVIHVRQLAEKGGDGSGE